MKLIIIYGPPAVGKLTVARELSKLTNFSVFHNHMTVDFLDPIIRFGTKGFFPLLGKIRLDIFETLAKSNVAGLIFTFVYSNPDDDDFLKKVIDVVESNGGEVCFVRLYCKEEILFQRVVNPSRKEFRKIKTIEGLKKDLEESDIASAVPFENNIDIENTETSAEEAVLKIIENFSIGKLKLYGHQ